MSQTGGTFSAVRITKGQLSKAKQFTVSLNQNLLYLAILEKKSKWHLIKPRLIFLC